MCCVSPRLAAHTSSPSASSLPPCPFNCPPGSVLSRPRTRRHPALFCVRTDAAAGDAIRPGACAVLGCMRLTQPPLGRALSAIVAVRASSEGCAIRRCAPDGRWAGAVPRMLFHSGGRLQGALHAACDCSNSPLQLFGWLIETCGGSGFFPDTDLPSFLFPPLSLIHSLNVSPAPFGLHAESPQDAQPLFDEVASFYASKGAPLPARPPLYLVEQNALNAAAAEAGGGEPGGSVRGLTLAEETVIQTVVRRPPTWNTLASDWANSGGNPLALNFGVRSQVLTRRQGARVTAIILLSAMPRLLCGARGSEDTIPYFELARLSAVHS